MDGRTRGAQPRRRRQHDVWAVNVDAEYLEEGEIVDDLIAAELAR